MRKTCFMAQMYETFTSGCFWDEAVLKLLHNNISNSIFQLSLNDIVLEISE